MLAQEDQGKGIDCWKIPGGVAAASVQSFAGTVAVVVPRAEVSVQRESFVEEGTAAILGVVGMTVVALLQGTGESGFGPENKGNCHLIEKTVI